MANELNCEINDDDNNNKRGNGGCQEGKVTSQNINTEDM